MFKSAVVSEEEEFAELLDAVALDEDTAELDEATELDEAAELEDFTELDELEDAMELDEAMELDDAAELELVVVRYSTGPRSGVPL